MEEERGREDREVVRKREGRRKREGKRKRGRK